MRIARPAALAAVAILAFAGCAGAPTTSQSTAPAVFDAGSLQRLAQHKVVELTGVIGAPSSQDTVADGMVYTWVASSLDATWVPTPVMTSGFISSLPKGADSSGGGGQNMEREVKCRVRVTGSGPDSYIRHIDFNGSRTACDPIKSRVADWVNKVG
jgi:hypothetical protein